MIVKLKSLLNKSLKYILPLILTYLSYFIISSIYEHSFTDGLSIPTELRGWFLMSIISPIMTGLLSTSNWINWIERHILYSHIWDEKINGTNVIEWLTLYLMKHKVYAFDGLTKIITNKNSIWWDDNKTLSARPQIYELPSGWIIFKYKSKYLLAYFPYPSVHETNFSHALNTYSNITIYSLKRINWGFFLEDISNYYYDNNQNATKMTVYRNIEKYVDDGCKTMIDLRQNASIDMCFGNPEKEKVWNSVLDFFNIETKNYFKKINQPYKTAYLIHGPTGTGKTELLFQLVSFTWKNYQRPLYIINPTGLNDNQLEDLFNGIQTGFILVDEWDLFLDNELKNKDVDMPSINSWLNILDRAPGELIFWFTTNNYQNLAKFNDGALIRPGRIDHIHKFDKMTPSEVRKAWNYFNPNDIDLKMIKDEDLDGLTISHIVNHLKKKLPIIELVKNNKK
jgi:hypothetical protein